MGPDDVVASGVVPVAVGLSLVVAVVGLALLGWPAVWVMVTGWQWAGWGLWWRRVRGRRGGRRASA